MNIRKNSGFTLMEILTVIAIMVVLAGILTPALNSARKQAKRAQCISNLKQIYIALQSYAMDNNGAFPAAATWTALLAGYMPPETVGGTSTVFNCPGYASATSYTYTPGSVNAETALPSDILVSCGAIASAPHPAPNKRNILYGDGHVASSAT